MELNQAPYGNSKVSMCESSHIKLTSHHSHGSSNVALLDSSINGLLSPQTRFQDIN